MNKKNLSQLFEKIKIFFVNNFVK